MQPMKYVAPTAGLNGFNCPFDQCNAYAKQNWKSVYTRFMRPGHHTEYPEVPNLKLAFCDHCGQFSLWIGSTLVHPRTMSAPPHHADMPENIRIDYEEARAVFDRSPRSSAALLRLAIQKICVELGLPGKNLNDDISKLVEKGLPVRIQQSLDIVRVVGNEQVHPGTLDVRDDPAMAMMLFELVNLIIEDRIASPKRIAELYAKLPQDKRDHIEKRDVPKRQP
jgi:hypothetical protein